MVGDFRARPTARTLELAIVAARRAGVTRLGDVTAFAVPGIWVYQATRPVSRTLAVSQGKGLTQAAAMISALLEGVELWSAEQLAPAGPKRPLSALGSDHLALWSGAAGPLRLKLDADRPRHWHAGSDLLSGRAYLAPFDFIGLDFSRSASECTTSTNGLATGNTRIEALVAGVAELLEHHAAADFARLSAGERRRQQIRLASIDEPAIRCLLGRIDAAGFDLRAWSMATRNNLAAIQCTMFARRPMGEDMLPVTGTGCHPDARTAFIRSLLEAVQTQATLVSGARDDLAPSDYAQGRERLGDLLLASWAFDDGQLDWSMVPHTACASSEACLEVLLAKAQECGSGPVIVCDHGDGGGPALEGLHIVHVLAPGLMDGLRAEPAPVRQSIPAQVVNGTGVRAPAQRRRILFAGPSIRGLDLPDGIELRPPAICGDLAALLDNPPLAVALVDGCFKTAPTVWHREILDLVAAGTHVFGGASLGALRAAELDRLGMVGVGAIYQAYRTGALVRDDAVLLEHAPPAYDYAPLTVALVDAEHMLFHADLPPCTLRQMQRIVRTMPYELRDWRTCLALYRERTGDVFPISLAELASAPSLKQADAHATIAALAADQADAVMRPFARPAITWAYQQMLASAAPASAAVQSEPRRADPAD